MGYELIEQIGTTKFCLTYETEERTLYTRVYIGEEDNETGAILTQKRLLNKQFDKVTSRAPEFQYTKKKILDHSLIIQYIKDNDISEKKFMLRVEDALDELLVKYMEWLDKADERAEKELKDRQEQEQLALEEIVSEGRDVIDEMKHPMLCVAWLIDWLTAGERLNILYAFIAYSSQVILKNPISVIGIGDGGSGKTHIQDVALSLIPDEFVLTIKSTTDAALYGFCDTDPYMFDGKIVNIGDMGGKNDHDEAQNFKNAMKEMQSDSFMARVKREAGADGKWENKTYELYGKPCLTYTNVPGFEFEDQEKSRSIFYQPRMDNDEAVMVFKTLSRMKGTPTADILEQEQSKVNDIKKMIIALRHRMEYVNIYNPYNDFVRGYLGKSKYFKRDVDKYDGILRVITAINGYRRDLVDNTLFTTKEDINMFLDILERYHDSITSNLSPGAADLLQELRDKAESWDLYEEGITVNDYLYKSATNLSKASARRYFSELNAEGYVKVDGKDGRANIYVLVSDGIESTKRNIELSELDKKIIEFNFDSEKVYAILNGPSSPLGVFSQPQTQPVWNDYLPENKPKVGR